MHRKEVSISVGAWTQTLSSVVLPLALILLGLLLRMPGTKERPVSFIVLSALCFLNYAQLFLHYAQLFLFGNDSTDNNSGTQKTPAMVRPLPSYHFKEPEPNL